MEISLILKNLILSFILYQICYGQSAVNDTNLSTTAPIPINIGSPINIGTSPESKNEAGAAKQIFDVDLKLNLSLNSNAVQDHGSTMFTSCNPIEMALGLGNYKCNFLCKLVNTATEGICRKQTGGFYCSCE